jgi:hypothetical protein
VVTRSLEACRISALNLDLCAGITDPASLKRPCNHVTESLWPLPLWTFLRRELTPDEGSWLKTYHPWHSSGPPVSSIMEGAKEIQLRGYKVS